MDIKTLTMAMVVVFSTASYASDEDNSGSEQGFWESSAEVVREVYQEYNDTEGDSAIEQISDDVKNYNGD